MAVIVRFSDPATPNAQPMHKLWVYLLAISYVDGASALQYHPWRGEEESLAYIVKGVRLLLVPPPTRVGWQVIAVAQTLFTPPPRKWWFGRPAPGPACGVVEFDMSGVVSVWDAVVWTTGERSGVELFRVTPPVETPAPKPDLPAV